MRESKEDIKTILEERYPITVSEVQLLQNIDDQVFLITSKKGEKYKFKLIHAPSEKRENQLEEIAKWMGYLNERVAVPLPSVHPTITGGLTFQLSKEQDSKTGILYHWIDWTILKQYQTENMRKLGQLLGQIHRLTKSYHHQETSLPIIDSQWVLKKALPGIIQVREQLSLSERALAQLPHKMNVLAEYLERQESISSQFGPIHSDIHRNNLIEKDGQLSLIDFDDAVFGPYLLDLGVILNELADHPHSYQAWTQGLLQGYCTAIGEGVSEEDLHRHRELANLIYADWIANLLRQERPVNQKKLNFGRQALINIIKIQ